MVSCSCIPPPASLKPRKIYNSLVPDVFPLQPPDPSVPISLGVTRKIGKLGEYAAKNPGRIPKISRRLYRKVTEALSKQQYGYVTVATHAYCHLLAESVKEESPYTFKYFSKELVQEPNHLIKTLLAWKQPEIQALGAQLLASYIYAQDEVDHEVEVVEDLVARVCSLLSAVKVAAVKVECLKAMRMFVLFCHRLKILPNSLEEIEVAVLNTLDFSGADSHWLAKQSKVTDSLSASDVTITTTDMPMEAQVADTARSILRQFQPFLKDISTVYRVANVLFRHLDGGSKWQHKELVQGLMALLKQSCEEQPFPLFTALMRHSSQPGLTSDDRAVIIQLANAQGAVYSLSAFSLALQELPKALAATQPSGGPGLRDTVYSTVKQLALEVGDATQLCEAISSSLRAYNQPGPLALECLRCCRVAAQQIPSFPPKCQAFAGRVFPALLISQLSAMMTGWEGEGRVLAQELVLLLLPCAGGVVRDERQVQPLLCAAWHLALLASRTPLHVAAAHQLASMCARSSRASALLATARLIMALQRECLQVHAGASQVALDAQRGCAVLLVVNTLLCQLAASASCPAVSALQIPLDAVACPELTADGSAGVLAHANEFVGSNPQASLELAAAARAHPAPQWSAAVAEALGKEGLLASEYGSSLQAQLLEPFDSSAQFPSALPMAQQPSSGLESSNDAAAKAVSSRLQSLARINRLASLRKERVNLRNVLSMIGDSSEPSSEAPAANGTSMASLSDKENLANGNGSLRAAPAQRVSVKDVLDMVASLPQKPTASAQVQLADLASQLEPVSH